MIDMGQENPWPTITKNPGLSENNKLFHHKPIAYLSMFHRCGGSKERDMQISTSHLHYRVYRYPLCHPAL